MGAGGWDPDEQMNPAPCCPAHPSLKPEVGTRGLSHLLLCPLVSVSVTGAQRPWGAHTNWPSVGCRALELDFGI